MNYEFTPQSFVNGEGQGRVGTLYYAVTDIEIYKFTLPDDIKSGRGSLTHGMAFKIDSDPHSIQSKFPRHENYLPHLFISPV